MYLFFSSNWGNIHHPVLTASPPREPEAEGVRGEAEESASSQGEGGARKTGKAAKEEKVAGSKHRYISIVLENSFNSFVVLPQIARPFFLVSVRF